MDYSYILNTSVPQKDKLLAFGFSEVGGILMLKKEIADGQFYAEIKLSEKTFTADVLRLRPMKSMYSLMSLLRRVLLSARFAARSRM